MNDPKKKNDTIRYNPKDNTFSGITTRDVEQWVKKFPGKNIEEGIADASRHVESRIKEWELAATLREPNAHLLAEKLKAKQKEIQDNPRGYLEHCISRTDDYLKPPEPEIVHPILKQPAQPLTEKARLIYKKLLILEQHEAMTLPEIQDWFYKTKEKDLDEGTWKDIRKELIPYGLKNKPRVGYYIEKK
jgi:hypothetical protein